MTFIKGLDLAERFYKEAVGPIVAERFPDLAYSAALIGEGSDVLGFDTPQSTDHDWGPRVMLFLPEADQAERREEIDRVLRAELPVEIAGYSTNLGWHEDGSRVMVAVERGPVEHRVTFHTVQSLFTDGLGFDPAGEIRAVDWVSVPDHRLLGLTAGRVFHDGLGQLETVRARLHYYPRDVWLYLLAAQWRRVAQEEAFMGRCGQVGDDLGSRLVAARLVRDLMRLCFLMERRYAPYIKWFGTAFAQLDCAAQLLPRLTSVLEANSWEARQAQLSAAYEAAAAMHNGLKIGAPLGAEVSHFHSRPFLVIHADRFVDAIRAEIGSDEVLALPTHLGSVDQFVDSTDAWSYLQRIGKVYQDTDSVNAPR
ncbi:MAG TPA: DUF4037 domain-containing protein [Anaerolineae bacterium]|nr:DUF4037 domain-containing protein [Anaerolineae bacterium]